MAPGGGLGGRIGPMRRDYGRVSGRSGPHLGRDLKVYVKTSARINRLLSIARQELLLLLLLSIMFVQISSLAAETNLPLRDHSRGIVWRRQN